MSLCLWMSLDDLNTFCLTCFFAKKCLRNSKAESMFPINNSKRIVRNQNRFHVNFAARERYRKSVIPYMQNLLNDYEKENAKFIRCKGF